MLDLQCEAKRLDDVLASKYVDWQQDAASVEQEIRELEEILADKESKTDRSENATFQIATDTRDIKIASLQVIRHKLESYETFRDAYKSIGVITIGSTVEVKLLSINDTPVNDGKVDRIIKIVGDGLDDARSNLIGTNSPIGSALLGRCVGDTVILKTRKGSLRYLVERMY